jgi:hypothetical protein
VTELRLELPYDLAFGQYEQILADFSIAIAPKLGWRLHASIGDERVRALESRASPA